MENSTDKIWSKSMSRFQNGWIRQYRDEVITQIGNDRYELLGLWSYLLAIASRFEVSIEHEGKRTLFPPGTIVTSLSELAGSSHKSKLMWIKRMLINLETKGLVKLSKSSRGQIISVVDWDEKYGEVSEFGYKNNVQNWVKNDEKRRDHLDTIGSPESDLSNKIESTLSPEIDSKNLNQELCEKSERDRSVTSLLPNRTLNGEREREEYKYNQRGEEKSGIQEIRENQKSSRRKRNPSSYPEEFEKIYREYPRKEGKTPGFRVYLREILSLDDLKNLEAAVANYRRAKCGTDAKYLLHFSTFMNQWRDWLEVPQTQKVIPISEKTVTDFFGRSA